MRALVPCLVSRPPLCARRAAIRWVARPCAVCARPANTVSSIMRRASFASPATMPTRAARRRASSVQPARNARIRPCCRRCARPARGVRRAAPIARAAALAMCARSRARPWRRRRRVALGRIVFQVRRWRPSARRVPIMLESPRRARALALPVRRVVHASPARAFSTPLQSAALATIVQTAPSLSRNTRVQRARTISRRESRR
jgi:hypothetical protein